MPLPKRVLLKVSGELFSNKEEEGNLKQFLASLKELQKKVEIAIVIGGGNILRGKKQRDRIAGDKIGMLATLINGISLSSALEEAKIANTIFCSFAIPSVIDIFNLKKAMLALKEKQVLIIVGGTSHPYFTTDSAAALYSLELNVDMLLKATKVDGIYDRDPSIKGAKKFKKVSFDDYLSQNLEVMDATAIALCREEGLNVRVFNLFERDGLKRALLGEIGTVVSK